MKKEIMEKVMIFIARCIIALVVIVILGYVPMR